MTQRAATAEQPLPKNARIGNPLAFLKHCIRSSKAIHPTVRRHIERFMYDIGNPDRLSPQQADIEARRVHARLQIARLEHTLTSIEPTSPRYPMLSKSAYYWSNTMDKLNRLKASANRLSKNDSTQQQPENSALWSSQKPEHEPDGDAASDEESSGVR